ncbi:MAG: hypothetical protein HY075_01345 [Deltaproteobacteria bacterium]|nr:hypothetical protein [Deltaproteobacteria bacterium]
MGKTRSLLSQRKRTNVGSGKKPLKFKSSRGVGTRFAEPDGYVPVAGSPSLDELRRRR